MGGPLADLATGYQAQYGDAVGSQVRLRELYNLYVRRIETTLIDTAFATLAIDSIINGDAAVTPQMEEAFARAFPGQDLDQRLEALKALAPDSNQVTGFMSNWKGIYHEILVRDSLNDSQQVGSVMLKEGQRAVLPDATNQPGLDLRILNADGTEDSVLQAKATNEIGLLSEALEKYPHIQIVATNEVADEMADKFLEERVSASGFDNEDLLSRLEQPMAEVWVGPVEEFIEQVLPGLPFLIITTTEGTRVLLGKQRFQAAVQRATQRGVKTSAAMGAGLLVALMGAGAFSLPATVLTRLGIDRLQVHTRLAKMLEADRIRLLIVR